MVACFVDQIGRLEALRGVAAEHQDRRPGTRHDGRETLGAQHLDERVGLGHRARPVALVQLVLGRREQQLGALQQGRDEQRGPRDVEDRVLVRHRFGLEAAGQRRRHDRLDRHGHHRRDAAVHDELLVARALRRHPGDREPAEQGGRHVVGVALERGREREQPLRVDLDDPLEQALGRHHAGDDRGARRPHPAAVRDAVAGFQLEARAARCRRPRTCRRSIARPGWTRRSAPRPRRRPRRARWRRARRAP